MTRLDQIEIQQFSDLTNQSPEDVQTILSTIPSEYGIQLEETTIRIDHQQVRQHTSDIFQVFYQLVPDREPPISQIRDISEQNQDPSFSDQLGSEDTE